MTTLDKHAPRYLAVHNTDTYPCPAYGVVEVIGIEEDGSAVRVRRPTTASLPPARVLFTGPAGLGGSAVGVAHATYPGLVLHDAALGTLAVGDTLGTQADSFQLAKGNDGFVSLDVSENGQSVVYAAADPTTLDDSSTVNVKGGTTAITSFAASTIDFDATYTTITNSPTGEANVELVVASAYRGGVLTAGTQTIIGSKTFDSILYATSGIVAGFVRIIRTGTAVTLDSVRTIPVISGYDTNTLYDGCGWGFDDINNRIYFVDVNGGDAAGFFSFSSALLSGTAEKISLSTGAVNEHSGVLRLLGGTTALLDLSRYNDTGYSANAAFSINNIPGISGTAPDGGVYTGGICTTLPTGGGGGTGDTSGPSSSVDGEIALFDSTTGKLLKRATGSGGVEATSGVYSTYTLTAAGKALLDDASASDQRTTLGLGSLATLSSVTTTEIAAATLVTESDGIASNDNDTTLPTSAAVKDYVDDAVAAGTGTPAGAIVMYGGSDTPTGWLRCDGSAVSRTTYAALFAVIGTTWGAGDGSTSFNVPNFAGRSPIGQGTGTGLTNRVQGTTGGAETHTLATSEMPAHTHGPASDADGFWDYFASSATLQAGSTYGAASRSATGSTGGGSAHNNMHPWLAISFLIKT